MVTRMLIGFLLLAILHCATTQSIPELLEGSGNDIETENLPSSLADDYVICEHPELESGSWGDEYNYDEPSDGSNETSVNATKGGAKMAPSVVEEIIDKQETNATTQYDEIDNKDETSRDEEDVVSSSFKMIKSSDIYSLPDSEPLETRFAAFVDEHPEEVTVTSPNYPNPYPNEINSIENYTVTGGIGIQVTIHDLDLNHEKDFLYIRGGSINDSDEKGPVLTGTMKEPMRFLIPHTTTFSVHFVAQQKDSEQQQQPHKGFRLTYAPFGTVVSPTPPTTTEMIVPQEVLQWFRVEITLSETMIASDQTWSIVKNALSNATNVFVEEAGLKYKPSRPDDVRLLARKCPDSWPGYEQCLTLEFAVPLRPIVAPIEDGPGNRISGGRKARGFISLTTTEEPIVEYQLSEANLERMWSTFGALKLAKEGIEVYKMPESSSILLIWIAISLCIVAAFLFVLYSIWKIDFFKDYRRISKLSRETQDEDQNELKKKEFDISMFPSPHQIVPSLFPTGDPYNDRNAEAQYAYHNAAMSPWGEEHIDEFGQATAVKTTPQQTRAQAFEPLSSLEYSPGALDFNEIPPQRSPGRNHNNPFFMTAVGNSGNFNQPGSAS